MENRELVSENKTKMNAIRLHSSQGPAGLVYEQIEKPEPQAGEVLVRVHAAAITRDELDWPLDRLPAIPSYEFSGVIVKIGSGVDDFSIGDPVFALAPFDHDGAAAEYIAIQREFLAPKPRTLNHVESAAIPLAALSAWQGLFEHGGLVEGQRVLIHGAAGGVGSFAVQLAHQCGAYVIGTASSMNVETAYRLGADQVIDHSTTSFETVSGSVDLLFDTVGGERLHRSPSVVRSAGKIVSVAAQLSQDAVARGIRTIYFVVEPNHKQLIELAGRVDRGRIRPIIDAVLPLMDARQAFERSLGNHGAGKIVLQVIREDG
jgi:NADPH:quinone reductase-like Zn-dependent oxidoreductase